MSHSLCLQLSVSAFPCGCPWFLLLVVLSGFVYFLKSFNLLNLAFLVCSFVSSLFPCLLFGRSGLFTAAVGPPLVGPDPASPIFRGPPALSDNPAATPGHYHDTLIISERKYHSKSQKLQYNILNMLAGIRGCRPHNSKAEVGLTQMSAFTAGGHVDCVLN